MPRKVVTWAFLISWMTGTICSETNQAASAIIPEDEQNQMSQMRSGHRQRAGSARRAGHEPEEGGGGTSECEEGWLAKRQTEEEASRITGLCRSRVRRRSNLFLRANDMKPSSPQRFDGLADRHASSEVHTRSPTLDRLHELLPQVESVCDLASGAGHTGLGFAGIASRIVAV